MRTVRDIKAGNLMAYGLEARSEEPAKPARRTGQKYTRVIT
jgi:hypothetical protein